MGHVKTWVGLAALLMVSGCVGLFTGPVADDPVMVLSVSEDGSHAVSSHRDERVMLWDLEDESVEVLSTSANIYSARFVGSDAAIWQELSGEVMRWSEEDGQEVLIENLGDDTYGHILSRDHERYVYSDDHWRLWVCEVEGSCEDLKVDGKSPSFWGSGKLLNLDMSREGSVLVTAGSAVSGSNPIPISERDPTDDSYRMSEYGELVLWDLNALVPTAKLPGHSAKTHATLSPDGRHVVSVDENGIGWIWATDSGEACYRLSRPGVGVWDDDEETRDTSGLRFTEEGFPEGFENPGYFTVNFVSSDEFVTAFYGQRHLLLYELGDPFGKKFLDLGTRPYPSTTAYLRNQSIDSAPEANVLVTGQSRNSGINVYDYDPDSRELEKRFSMYAPQQR